MKKYKVSLSNGSYEEFLEESLAIDYKKEHPDATIETIEIVEVQPDIEDIIKSYYEQATWQNFIDSIQLTGVSQELLHNSNIEVCNAAWNMYQVILGLLDWPIKQRTLTAEYRTFCYFIHTLAYSLSPSRVISLLDTLKACNINVLHIDHLVDNLKTAKLLDTNYTY